MFARRRPYRLGLIILGMLGALAGPAFAAEPTIEELLNATDDIARGASSHATLEMQVKTARYERTMKIEAWSKGEDKSLIRILEPAKDAGISTLMVDDNIWNYLPKVDRTMKVPGAMMSGNWMGSHFTNDDLLKQSSWYRDYETTLKWVDRAGERQLEMTSIPRPDAPVVYTRIVQWLNAESWIPIQADYFDGKTVIRSLHFRDIKDFGGRKIPTKIELIPHDAPGERTVVIYRSMTFDAAISEELFTPRGLRRAAQTR